MEALDRDLALRIALAKRVLPGVEVSHLIDVLHERLGAPLDDEKLKLVTVTNLKTGLGEIGGEEDGEDIGIGLHNIKLAVRCLWGEEADRELPEIRPYRDGEMPGSVRVALASNSGATLNGHFGSCLRFLVYQVSRDEIRLVDIRSCIDADAAEDKNRHRVALVSDCHVLFVRSVGGPAAAKIVRADVYPMKVPEVIEAEAKLAEFQRVLDAPPPWLAKILGFAAGDRRRYRSD